MVEAASDENLGYRIVVAVAEERDVDPLGIDEVLYDVVDVEGLERVLRRSADDRPIEFSASFEFADCHVTVSGDGSVRAEAAG